MLAKDLKAKLTINLKVFGVCCAEAESVWCLLGTPGPNIGGSNLAEDPLANEATMVVR